MTQGTAILFVSHKLEEVLSLCDRITVLRDGETTLTNASMQGMTRHTLIEAMIGRAERPVLRAFRFTGCWNAAARDSRPVDSGRTPGH